MKMGFEKNEPKTIWSISQSPGTNPVKNLNVERMRQKSEAVDPCCEH